MHFVPPAEGAGNADSGIETESPVSGTESDHEQTASILRATRRAGKRRVCDSRHIPRVFPVKEQRGRLEMYGYTVIADAYIQNLKVPAIFDTGAASTMVSPRVLAKLHSPPEVLPYDKSYGGVCPEARLTSQGVALLPFELGDTVYSYRAVVADMDCPLIIGADFMLEHQAQIRFHRKGGKVTVGSNGSTFPIRVVKKFMAQWVKTRITECIRPGEEKIVATRMVNYLHRARPSRGEGGLLEPSTSLRAQGALVPYAYLLAHEDSSVTVYNSGEEPLWLNAGTILGHWSPAQLVTRARLDDQDELSSSDEEESYDSAIPHTDQGYESDEESLSDESLDDESVDGDAFEDSASSSYSSESESSTDTESSESDSDEPVRVLPTAPTASSDPLQGYPHLRKLVAESDLQSRLHKRQLSNLLTEYSDVMVDPKSPLGRTPLAEHHIDTGEALPIRQVVRPPAKSLAGTSEAEIKRMLEQGLIRPSDSPWASPVVLVKKKDGTVRFCVDYRKLNEVTRKDAYPLPRIEACFDCLGRSTWFCTLDLRSGYWQVPVAEQDIEKTAFITPQGLFEYLVMPFGLTNAPATFERLMERVLKGLQWKQCLVYIDDIIVFGPTFAATLDNLRQVLHRLRQAGLTCKPKKCELFRKRVAFLGHIVSKEGLECDPAKVKSVADWPVPTTVKDIRSFLGLAGYYRRFIPHFASYSAPLTELTKINVPFEWTKRQQVAFDFLKSSLCNPPILSYPTDDGVYILDTDASNYGIGAVLSQLQGSSSEEKVIAYASKTLQPSQRAYCTTKKELYAMVYFVKHFRHYLLGRRFVVRTDHASLLWLLNFKNPEGILARWLMTLSSYMPFDSVIHRPGKDHANADALSRIPVTEPLVTKRCPTTYVGCPSCYPGAVTIDVSTGTTDVTVNIAQARRNLRAGRPKTKTVRVSDPAPQRDSESTDSGGSTSSTPAPTDPSLREGSIPMTRSNFSSWTFGWSNAYLRQAQRDDPELNEVLIRRQKHSRPPPADLRRRESHELKTYWSQYNALTVVDGLLYRRYRLRPEADPVLQLVLPRSLRQTVLAYAHDLPLSAHRGEHGTISTLRARFYWPLYRRDAKLYVRACERCQKSKPPAPGRAPLTQVAAGEPMECCAMDLLGPFDPPTDQGNRYVLVVGDVFSKWIEAYAIPNKEATTVAKHLADFFCRFGLPQRLHSDRGTEFRNKVLDEVARILQIQPTFTTAYRPQSNGMIERFNRTLIKMLKTFIDDFVHPTTWDTLLPMLTGAYRATEHASTGCTPNLLFMGREVNLPVDVLAGAPPRQRTHFNAASYGQWLAHAMATAHQYARSCLGRSATRQKRGYDARSKPRKWTPTIGEWVYLYYPPYSRHKLGSPWIGPYVVTRKLQARTWLIQAAPDKSPRVVHEDNLKPVQGRLQQQDNWIRQQIEAGTLPQDSDPAYQSPEDSAEEELDTPAPSEPSHSRAPSPPLPKEVIPPVAPEAPKEVVPPPTQPEPPPPPPVPEPTPPPEPMPPPEPDHSCDPDPSQHPEPVAEEPVEPPAPVEVPSPPEDPPSTPPLVPKDAQVDSPEVPLSSPPASPEPPTPPSAPPAPPEPSGPRRTSRPPKPIVRFDPCDYDKPRQKWFRPAPAQTPADWFLSHFDPG